MDEQPRNTSIVNLFLFIICPLGSQRDGGSLASSVVRAGPRGSLLSADSRSGPYPGQASTPKSPSLRSVYFSGTPWMKLPEFPAVSSGFHPAQTLGGYPAAPSHSLLGASLRPAAIQSSYARLRADGGFEVRLHLLVRCIGPSRHPQQAIKIVAAQGAHSARSFQQRGPVTKQGRHWTPNVLVETDQVRLRSGRQRSIGLLPTALSGRPPLHHAFGRRTRNG